jgi:predicted trehalose synthase
VADAFLSGYTSRTDTAELVPPPYAFTQVLRAFMLDKAVYELEYELNNRPDWVRIPLTGILKLLR